MSQERNGELSPLIEVLEKHGELLERIAADQSRPLELDELPQLADSAPLPWTDFDSHEVIGFVGWPDSETWAGEPSVQFAGGDEGDLEFFAKALEDSGAINGVRQGLNNLWPILHTKPYAFDGKTPRSPREMVYAPMPALIRAWTAFPEFMGALQLEMQDMRKMFEKADEFAERIEDDEPHLLRASRLAYGLLTRLICRGDRDVQATLQNTMFPDAADAGPKRHFRPITDPSVELWT